MDAHECATVPCPLCDLRPAEPPALQPPFTTICNVCDVVRYEPLSVHLESCHLNEFFKIDADPETGVSTIIERA